MADRPTKEQLRKWRDEFGGNWAYDPARRKLVLRHYWPKGSKPPHTERGETAKECIDHRTRRRRDIGIRATLNGDGTIGSVLKAWFESAEKGRAESTVTGYRNSIRHLTERLGGDTLWTDLVTGDVASMYGALHNDGLGKDALTKVKTHLGMAVGFGITHNLLPTSVPEHLRPAKPPEIRRVRREDRWFELDEFEAVREDLLRRHDVPDVLALTMMLCGLRPGEALGLRWEYVDLGKRALRVEGQIKRRHNLYTHVLKTDHRHDLAHRTVPIPADLALVLGGLERLDLGEFVFVRTSGRAKGLRMDHDAVTDHVKLIAGRARVPWVNPTGYRHTFASVCLHNGMLPVDLAPLMGHQDTTEINRTYGHAIKNTTPPDMDRFLGTQKP
jgi:integrase